MPHCGIRGGGGAIAARHPGPPDSPAKLPRRRSRRGCWPAMPLRRRRFDEMLAAGRHRPAALAAFRRGVRRARGRTAARLRPRARAGCCARAASRSTSMPIPTTGSMPGASISCRCCCRTQEWDALAAGIVQRARLIDAVLADLHGDAGAAARRQPAGIARCWAARAIVRASVDRDRRRRAASSTPTPATSPAPPPATGWSWVTRPTPRSATATCWPAAWRSATAWPGSSATATPSGSPATSWACRRASRRCAGATTGGSCMLSPGTGEPVLLQPLLPRPLSGLHGRPERRSHRPRQQSLSQDPGRPAAGLSGRLQAARPSDGPAASAGQRPCRHSRAGAGRAQRHRRHGQSAGQRGAAEPRAGDRSRPGLFRRVLGEAPLLPDVAHPLARRTATTATAVLATPERWAAVEAVARNDPGEPSPMLGGGPLTARRPAEALEERLATRGRTAGSRVEPVRARDHAAFDGDQAGPDALRPARLRRRRRGRLPRPAGRPGPPCRRADRRDAAQRLRQQGPVDHRDPRRAQPRQHPAHDDARGASAPDRPRSAQPDRRQPVLARPLQRARRRRSCGCCAACCRGSSRTAAPTATRSSCNGCCAFSCATCDPALPEGEEPRLGRRRGAGRHR